MRRLPPVGDTRVIDREFIRDLGRNIDRAAEADLPSAKSSARDAQDAMMGAGQAGGLLAVMGFFFASEYCEHAWQTKLEEAGTLDEGAQRVAQNWQTVEEGNTFRGE